MPVYHCSCPPSDTDGTTYRAKTKRDALRKYKNELTNDGEDEMMMSIWSQVREDIVITRLKIKT